MNTVGERIKAIRKELKLTQIQFGESLGVTGGAIAMIERNINSPSMMLRNAIISKFSVNPLYLDGESDIMFVPPDDDAELIDRALASGNPIIKALLLGIVKSPDGWEVLARSILEAADTLRALGIDIDQNEKKPER